MPAMSGGTAKALTGGQPQAKTAPDLDRGADLDATVRDAGAALAAAQRGDGHWLFELEADVTVSAEYVLVQHFLDEIDAAEERRIVRYLRAAQGQDGGWPLFAGGVADVSATVKAYYALKLSGDAAEAPHMRRARELVLARGGAARANVFTRVTLALFGQVPWRAVPAMPVEIMALPRWFPFHLSKISYWSRTVIAPSLVLMAIKPRAKNPRALGIAELFTVPPEHERAYTVNPTGAVLGELFLGLDRLVRTAERLVPRAGRRRAIENALAFMNPRLNGEDGLGGIFPAIANSIMALDALGTPADDPRLAAAKRALKRLTVERDGATYCQPCVSPVWDTALAAHALSEAGGAGDAVAAGCRWLAAREATEPAGDWSLNRPGLTPGGWAFQYRNDYYPDVDDTAVVAMALHRADRDRYREPLERSVRWVLGMQCENGGWGSFDADNTHYHLNSIPFADHGALLDPPTADVSARCLGMLAQLGYGREHPAVRGAVDFLRRGQEPDGSWYGRWGVNYVYGTWSALCALNAVGESVARPGIRRAVAWLKDRQADDGGWGESCASYWPEDRGQTHPSTASQTAWALLGLMAAGEVESAAVKRGVGYLLEAPREGARWREEHWTGVGFPRVFYLKYHGYAAYFPLWALARYRSLVRSNDPRVATGI